MDDKTKDSSNNDVCSVILDILKMSDKLELLSKEQKAYTLFRMCQCLSQLKIDPKKIAVIYHFIFAGENYEKCSDLPTVDQLYKFCDDPCVAEQLLHELDTDPDFSLEDVLKHPFHWNVQDKIDFVCKACVQIDRSNMMEMYKINEGKDIIPEDGWIKMLKLSKKEMKKLRKLNSREKTTNYSDTSIYDLAIKEGVNFDENSIYDMMIFFNKTYLDFMRADAIVRNVFADSRTDFFEFFRQRFPKFFIHIYKKLKRVVHFKGRPAITPYSPDTEAIVSRVRSAVERALNSEKGSTKSGDGEEKIKIIKIIGQGGQSIVYEGLLDGRIRVAVKKVNVDNYNKEVDILRKLDHPNIIKILAVNYSDEMKSIALEYCEYTLKKYVTLSDEEKNLTPVEVLEQVTDGLHYLHNGVKFYAVHGDLKPSNILFQKVDREKIWRVKISDFGISKELHEDHTSTDMKTGGSPGYIAPELLFENTDGKMRKPMDVFCLGIIFCYTLSGGKHPFGNDRCDINRKVRECDPCLNDLPLHCKDTVETLIKSMLQKNCCERVTVDEVKYHHIFWDAENKLLFLQQTSNYIENRDKKQKLIKRLEDDLKSVSDIPWKDKICSENLELKKVIEKYGKEEKSMQDLLRKIRNWSYHFFDAKTTDAFQTALGGKSEYPTGFIAFFERLFPRLLPTCYETMRTEKKEDIFKSFYAVK